MTKEDCLSLGFKVQDMGDCGEYIYFQHDTHLYFNLVGNDIWIGEHKTCINTIKEFIIVYFLLTGSMPFWDKNKSYN